MKNLTSVKKTQLGYPVLSDDLHDKIFGTEKPQKMSRLSIQKAENLLKEFDIPVPVDHPAGLYDGPLPLPDLKGDFLRDHFEKIAGEQVGRYKKLGDQFSRCKLPPLPPPDQFVFEPGWVRYEWVENEDAGGWYIEHVDFPEEEAFTFDTETYVHGGAFPIIGTALSEKAAYVWMAAELIDPTIPESQWDQHELIPIGTNRFIPGHNISYDRVRAREGYNLDQTTPENFYFDTLSAHIGVSGLASGQRWLYVLAGKDPESLTPDEKRKLRYAPKWLDKGATNSLVQCYNFHVAAVRKYFGEDVKELGDVDKKVRDIFVDATHLSQIRQVLTDALDYALKDAYYTAELFQALWPKYLDSTPSMVALCGHYHLNGSIIPLVDNWSEWIEDVESVYKEYNDEMTQICKDLVWKTYEDWRVLYLNDPAKAQQWVRRDPWVSQLDWEIKSTKGKYAHIPNWVRPFIKDENQHIGVKSNLAHLMLKLKYENSPMIFTKNDGWCYHDEDGNLTKIPHPKGNGDNVGGVLSKDFVEDMAVGRLSSDLPEAKRALEIANSVSYWTSVRKRVMDRIFLRANNPYGEDSLVTLPEILCHGTVTRRTVESLMVTMCSTKNWRIGTELKTRVKAPDGWKIVGADFDGQEMQIASIYSDKWEGGHIGCSPFGYNVLSGSKEAGTDPHSALAKLAGVDRDTAKIAGFAVLYGAGVRAVQTYIRRKYPEKSPTEVKNFAYRILEGKKGKQRSGLYEGGSDSGCFNYMEEIAMRTRVPQLPCLGTKISTAMRPAAVGDDFKTGRVNWTIQSSGAEILSIFLTSIHWLTKEYKIPARFILSIHDEIWFMTPDRYAEQFAVLFQIAHMYTWSLFHSAVGIPELPLSRAYFSSVAIDNRIRKSPKEKTVTPSNPGGDKEPAGVEYSMRELSEIGAIDKLNTRFNAIKKGLIK
jgi:DNA polymerase gamma 1